MDGERCDLQGSQFGHVVEAGNGDVANVVVVQRSVERKERTKSLALAQSEKSEHVILKYARFLLSCSFTSF